ncbi:MAG: hypothetical protein JNG85_11570 [Spirochaetaceae bacterium]|nr:hypothetical protein [Spirochaetaceae bacterium]
MKARAISFLLLPLLVSVSCSRVGDLKLAANPPLSAGLGYALVKDSYVSLAASPGSEAAGVSHLRDGTLVELVGRELGTAPAKGAAAASGNGAAPASKGAGTEFWYRVRVVADTKAGEDAPAEGWVMASQLLVFESREQAERAAKAAVK